MRRTTEAVLDEERPPSLDSNSAFSFRNVTRTFPADGGREFVAVQDISLDIKPSSLVCLIGPSGCGKSTLLSMAAGLLRPSEGEVAYRGRPVTDVNTSVGFMTQHDNLLPWRTVEKNVAISLEIQGIPRAQRKERVRQALELVGLSGFANRYPSQLSGGMQKRTSLARALVYDPSTLLMDEPFGALDAQLRLAMQNELLSIWSRDRKTIIFVTHDLDEAVLLADQVVVFGTRPGRIIHIEDIHLSRPRNLVELRVDPEYGAIWERLWKLLEPEAKRGTA